MGASGKTREGVERGSSRSEALWGDSIILREPSHDPGTEGIVGTLGKPLGANGVSVGGALIVGMGGNVIVGTG